MLKKQVARTEGGTGSFRAPSNEAVPFLYTSTKEFDDRRHERMKEIRVRNEAKLMEECTFHPDVHARQPKLSALEMSERRRRSRIEQILIEKQKDITLTPCLVAAPCKSRDNSMSVYERLYSLSKPTTPKETPRSSASFSTPRSARSVPPLSSRLYSDYLSRKSRMIAQEDLAVREARRNATPLITKSTDRLFINGLERESRKFLNGAVFVQKIQLSQLFDFLGFLHTFDKQNSAIDSVTHLLDETWQWLIKTGPSEGPVLLTRLSQFFSLLYSDSPLSKKFAVFRDNRRASNTRKQLNKADPKRTETRSVSPRLSVGSQKIMDKISLQFGHWERKGLQPSELLRLCRGQSGGAGKGVFEKSPKSVVGPGNFSNGQRVQVLPALSPTSPASVPGDSWNRLYQSGLKRMAERKQAELRWKEEKIVREMASCSFTPSTNAGGEGRRRTRQISASIQVRDFRKTTERLASRQFMKSATILSAR